MKMFKHPLWLVGFRPFFILAMLSGAILPLIWGLAFSGVSGFSKYTSLQWHSHEMLFGFGWAVLAGFLLTASKNWLKIRGLHGGWLTLLTALWIFERVIMGLHASEDWPFAYLYILSSLSVFMVVFYLIGCLVIYRKQDTFKDNFFFVLVLPVLLIAKALLLSKDHSAAGWMLSIGVYRMAFAVMFERTITQFMKNSFGKELYRNPWLDYSIKFGVLVSVFSFALPTLVAVAVLALTGLLLLARFFLWSPVTGFKKFEIGIMYLGYLGLTTHFFFEAARFSGKLDLIGAISVHVFTFLCMGIVIPGMLIRISQGHTGRKLVFTVSDKLALYLMMLSGFSRLVLTQILPGQYQTWILISGLGWFLCFTIIAARLIPFLLQPRIDGKVH